MLISFRGKLRKSILSVAVIVLCLHAFQWFHIYCGIIIFRQNTKDGYTYIVRAMPSDAFGYIILSTIRFSYFPDLLDCNYKCEIWRNNNMLTSHSYYWDSMYNPIIEITCKDNNKDSKEVQFSFSNCDAAKCTYTGTSRGTTTWTEINLNK